MQHITQREASASPLAACMGESHNTQVQIQSTGILRSTLECGKPAQAATNITPMPDLPGADELLAK